jgi:hypothetical protein
LSRRCRIEWPAFAAFTLAALRLGGPKIRVMLWDVDQATVGSRVFYIGLVLEAVTP